MIGRKPALCLYIGINTSNDNNSNHSNKRGGGDWSYPVYVSAFLDGALPPALVPARLARDEDRVFTPQRDLVRLGGRVVKLDCRLTDDRGQRPTRHYK